MWNFTLCFVKLSWSKTSKLTRPYCILAAEVKKVYPRLPARVVPTTTNEEIPRPVHRLTNHDEYRKLDVSTPTSDSCLTPDATIKNMDDIQAAINEYGSQLLESIIIFDSN